MYTIVLNPNYVILYIGISTVQYYFHRLEYHTFSRGYHISSTRLLTFGIGKEVTETSERDNPWHPLQIACVAED